MLASPVTREASRTVLATGGGADADRTVAEALDALEEEARAGMAREGADPDALEARRTVDARYRGQSFELAVAEDEWRAAFHDAHEERYGYRRPETPVEAVTVRVVVTAPPTEVAAPRLPDADGPPETRAIRVRHGGKELNAVAVRRDALRAGHRLAGPLVVQEYSATTWVPPEWTLEVDAWGCLHLTPSEEEAP
jgi:N-methylhydantoinase A